MGILACLGCFKSGADAQSKTRTSSKEGIIHKGDVLSSDSNILGKQGKDQFGSKSRSRVVQVLFPSPTDSMNTLPWGSVYIQPHKDVQGTWHLGEPQRRPSHDLVNQSSHDLESCCPVLHGLESTCSNEAPGGSFRFIFKVRTPAQVSSLGLGHEEEIGEFIPLPINFRMHASTGVMLIPKLYLHASMPQLQEGCSTSAAVLNDVELFRSLMDTSEQLRHAVVQQTSCLFDMEIKDDAHRPFESRGNLSIESSMGLTSFSVSCCYLMEPSSGALEPSIIVNLLAPQARQASSSSIISTKPAARLQVQRCMRSSAQRPPLAPLHSDKMEYLAGCERSSLNKTSMFRLQAVLDLMPMMVTMISADGQRLLYQNQESLSYWSRVGLPRSGIHPASKKYSASALLGCLLEEEMAAVMEQVGKGQKWKGVRGVSQQLGREATTAASDCNSLSKPPSVRDWLPSMPTCNYDESMEERAASSNMPGKTTRSRFAQPHEDHTRGSAVRNVCSPQEPERLASVSLGSRESSDVDGQLRRVTYSFDGSDLHYSLSASSIGKSGLLTRPSISNSPRMYAIPPRIVEEPEAVEEGRGPQSRVFLEGGSHQQVAAESMEHAGGCNMGYNDMGSFCSSTSLHLHSGLSKPGTQISTSLSDQRVMGERVRAEINEADVVDMEEDSIWTPRSRNRSFESTGKVDGYSSRLSFYASSFSAADAGLAVTPSTRVMSMIAARDRNQLQNQLLDRSSEDAWSCPGSEAGATNRNTTQYRNSISSSVGGSRRSIGSAVYRIRSKSIGARSAQSFRSCSIMRIGAGMGCNAGSSSDMHVGGFHYDDSHDGGILDCPSSLITRESAEVRTGSFPRPSSGLPLDSVHTKSNNSVLVGEGGTGDSGSAFEWHLSSSALATVVQGEPSAPEESALVTIREMSVSHKEAQPEASPPEGATPTSVIPITSAERHPPQGSESDRFMDILKTMGSSVGKDSSVESGYLASRLAHSADCSSLSSRLANRGTSNLSAYSGHISCSNQSSLPSSSQVGPSHSGSPVNGSKPALEGSWPLNMRVPKDSGASQTNLSVQGEAVKAWHEINILPVLVPGSGEKVMLLLQCDITTRTELEMRMTALTEAQLDMLESMLPRHVLEYVVSSSDQNIDMSALARSHDHVTVMFIDIVGFTAMSKEVTSQAVMGYLNEMFTWMDNMLEQYNVYKVDTAGDCYIVAGGLMTRDDDGVTCLDSNADPVEGARNVFEFAMAFMGQVEDLPYPHTGLPTAVRVGIHTGSCVSGLIGTKLPKFSLWGDTMNTASRMESTSKSGHVQLSETTYELLPEVQQQMCSPTGGVEVKGKGVMQTYLWSCGHSVHLAPGANDSSPVWSPMESPVDEHELQFCPNLESLFQWPEDDLGQASKPSTQDATKSKSTQTDPAQPICSNPFLGRALSKVGGLELSRSLPEGQRGSTALIIPLDRCSLKSRGGHCCQRMEMPAVGSPEEMLLEAKASDMCAGQLISPPSLCSCEGCSPISSALNSPARYTSASPHNKGKLSHLAQLIGRTSPSPSRRTWCTVPNTLAVPGAHVAHKLRGNGGFSIDGRVGGVSSKDGVHKVDSRAHKWDHLHRTHAMPGSSHTHCQHSACDDR